MDMFHPHVQLADVGGDVGMALVATRPIPAGTVMWALCEFDIVLDGARIPQLPRPYREVLDRYAFVSPTGDAILQWDLARFANHSCDAICHSVAYDVEIAVRDVAPGEQVTTEYGNLNRNFHFQCACGTPRCRGFVRHDDVLRHGDEWDRMIADVLPLYSMVEQPLAAVLAGRVSTLAVLEGRHPLIPSRNGYCPPHRLPDLRPPPEAGANRPAPTPGRRSRHASTRPVSIDLG
jgi:uncharacterized protein